MFSFQSNAVCFKNYENCHWKPHHLVNIPYKIESLIHMHVLLEIPVWLVESQLIPFHYLWNQWMSVQLPN